jgi:hypothetical protein
LATLKDLVTKYDALTDQEKKEANAAIQGKSFTSYNAMIQAFAKAVDKQKAALDAVNTATDAASMKSALETNAAGIGINVSATSDYGKLIGDATVTQDVYANQLSVAQDVYDNKPNGGYMNVADVKSVFDAAVQVKTAQVNALKDVQAAQSADDLADVKYINDVIAALENASKTTDYTTSSGRTINDILDELKADVTQYTALTDEAKKAVNGALAGKTFATYSDLMQAFEEAVKANTANDSSAQGSQQTTSQDQSNSTGTTSGTQTTDTQTNSTSDSTQSSSGQAESTQTN